MSTRKAANGEGTIYKTAAGDWRAALPIRKPDGSAGRKYFQAPTRREVREKRDRWLAEQARSQDTGDANATLAAYLDGWLAGPVSVRVRPRTRINYAWVVDRVKPSAGAWRLRELKPKHVQQIVTDMTKDGYSPTSIRLMRRVLSIALRDAVRARLITVNPVEATTPPRKEKRTYRVLSAVEAQTLLASAEQAGDPERALWWVLLTTGVRVGEALGLHWEDIDPAERAVRFQRQYRRANGGWEPDPLKTETSNRLLPLLPDTLAQLDAHRGRQRLARIQAPRWAMPELVFASTTGEPRSPDAVRTQLHRALRAAGLPVVRVHDLRHTTASLLLKLGVPLPVIAAMLGHSSIHITGDIYTHTDLDLLREASALLGAAIRPVSEAR